jgi:uncharacterized membrane-anchored protein
MSRPRRFLLLAVVLAQLAVPLGLAGLAATDLSFGREIRLKAEPVDPIDIFRGNYVALRYEISLVPVNFDVDRRDRICISLFEASDNRWQGGFGKKSMPESGPAICGRARRDARAGERVPVDYGIETYFASEERAKELERSIGEGQLYVVIDLDDDGSARIERLEVD